MDNSLTIKFSYMKKFLTSLLSLALITNTLDAQILRVHDGGPIIGLNGYGITAESPAANTYNIDNQTIYDLAAGTLYDSGGPAGNYGNNELLSAEINSFGLNADSLVLDVTYDFEVDYDSLVIRDGNLNVVGILKGVGSATYVINYPYAELSFYSNSSNTGSGFTLTWRVKGEFKTAPQVYDNLYETGNKLMWLPWKGAIRAGTDEGNWAKDSIGESSTAFGFNALASGIFSTAWGNNSTASSLGSTAWGDFSTASGIYSTAWGGGAEASGSYSTAWGNSVLASGDYSVAFGTYSRASGGYSTAFGAFSKALGDYSTTWGYKDSAVADYSVAFGYYSTASGDYSTVFGRYANAHDYAETAFGNYNVVGTGNQTSWDAADRLLSVGNGDSGAKNDAFLIYKNGDAELDGTLTQGSDINIKKDIKRIENANALLSQINGYTYFWKDQEQRGTDKQMGVIAQEVQQVLPDLVKKTSNGHLGVNYMGLIPVLIEANKELRIESEELEAKNEQQAKAIQNLQSEVGQLKEKFAKMEALMERLDTDMEYCCETQPQGNKTEGILEESDTSGYLEQNVPNPFDEGTFIAYRLPEGAKQAELQISTLNGTIIKSFPLQANRNGKITLKSGTLAAGAYLYSLIVDEKVMDTKQMILVK